MATEHYHEIVGPLRAGVNRLERTKTGAQVFRFLRLTVVGLVAAYVSGQPVDAVVAIGVAEVAFRQVFG